MRIVVIAGGLSPERDVSLSSGSLIANALIELGYKALLVDLYKGVSSADFDALFTGEKYSFAVPECEPDLDKLKSETNNGNCLIGKNIIDLCKNADIVFNALHGDIGENGKLQAIFDAYGINYTGTGYVGSMLAMDKDLAKSIMVQHDIITAEWKTTDNMTKLETLYESIGFPCVIKPCGCGSSVGVSIVQNTSEYRAAIEYALKYENKIMVEKMVAGREFSVGVLAGQALPVIEIIPVEGFYDYKNKYQVGLAHEECPANIPNEVSEKMQDAALRVHKALQLGSYSRIDFIVDDNNNVFCLEANTLPGMTPTSLLPQEAAVIGISYNELCDKIVKLALSNA